MFLSTKRGWTVATNLVKTHSFSCWGQKSGGTGAQGLGRPQAGLLTCFSLHFFTILQIYHTLPYFTYLYVFFFADSCHLYLLHSIAWILFISSLANPNGPIPMDRLVASVEPVRHQGSAPQTFCVTILDLPRRFDAPWPGMLGQSGAWLPWRRLQPASLYGLVPQRAQQSKCQWRTGRRIFLDPLKMVLMWRR